MIFDGGFAQIFSQIASITVKKLRNTNFISSRHVKRENTSLPVDVRRSKTSLLKLPIDGGEKRNRQLAFELQNLHVCEKRSKLALTDACNVFVEKRCWHCDKKKRKNYS